MRFSAKSVLLGFTILVVSVLVHDIVRPVDRELTTRAAIYAIQTYRLHVSPRIGGFVTCRFEPTCSVYGLEAVQRHGAFIGGARALGRILRCGPWTEKGTVDEVEKVN